MKQDNAVVIFCMVALFAVVLWKARDEIASRDVPIVEPVPEDAPAEVIVDGPGMIVPSHAARAPYRFLPPNILATLEASNRRKTSDGAGAG